MIDVRGRDESRFWWAWGKDPSARLVDIVFFREIDEPYRVGTGVKIGRLHFGWVTEWREDELAATGSRYIEDVGAEVLGQWGADEGPQGPQEDSDPHPQDVELGSRRVERDRAQRLSQYLPRHEDRAPSSPRPLRGGGHSVRDN